MLLQRSHGRTEQRQPSSIPLHEMLPNENEVNNGLTFIKLTPVFTGNSWQHRQFKLSGFVIYFTVCSCCIIKTGPGTAATLPGCAPGCLYHDAVVISVNWYSRRISVAMGSYPTCSHRLTSVAYQFSMSCIINLLRVSNFRYAFLLEIIDPNQHESSNTVYTSLIRPPLSSPIALFVISAVLSL